MVRCGFGVFVMALRTEIWWLRRDLRLVYVLLVWTAFAVSILYYFSGDISFHSVSSPRREQARELSDEEIYTGSIVMVPPKGDQCWLMKFDNRTGRMWETGYVNCYTAVGSLAQSRRSGALSSVRIQSISNAFRRDE
jgi:hypothetical protein